MRLLLDTHSFLWLADETARMSKRALEAVQHQDSALYLSSVSAWEIAQKYKKRLLRLPMPPALFIGEVCAHFRIEPLEFDHACVAHLEGLPNLHKDPFDRMLICQAIEHGLAIVTDDRCIAAYPVKTVW